MTMAALGACALDSALSRALPAAAATSAAAPGPEAAAALQTGLARLAASFQKELFAAIQPAWLMSSGEDSRRVLQGAAACCPAVLVPQAEKWQVPFPGPLVESRIAITTLG